jgi:hypothetical protein
MLNIEINVALVLIPKCLLKSTLCVGCVGAELLLGQPLFPGDSGVDQLVEIIKVSDYI